MNLDSATIAALAAHLETCEREARDTPKITDEHPGMDWDDAYAIQDEILRRKQARGARLVGYKAGLTSHAKMRQMGVDTPCFGFLVDEFCVPEGAEIPAGALIHPKVEPEIAFILKHPLRGRAAMPARCWPRPNASCPASRSSTAATAISSSTSRA